MDQVLVELQPQLSQQRATLSRLSDSFVTLHHAVTNTAGTPDAPGDALVRLPFLNDKLQPLHLATKADESRARTCNREIGDLRQVVTDANVAIHQRIDNERSTGLRTMEDLASGFKKLQDFVNQERAHHAQAKEETSLGQPRAKRRRR